MAIDTELKQINENQKFREVSEDELLVGYKATNSISDNI